MSWIKREDRKPDATNRYLVLINCDGKEKESYCKFSVRKDKFHFDMPHINWKVTYWFDLKGYKKYI